MNRFSNLALSACALALGACATAGHNGFVYTPAAANVAPAKPAPVSATPHAAAPSVASKPRPAAAPLAAAAPVPPLAPAPTRADADTRFKVALHLLQTHQLHDAEAAFASLAHDFPSFSGPLTDLGIVYAQGRRPDDAVASLSRAIKANPGNAVALNWLGILYRKSGEYSKSEDAYKRAIAARSDYAPAHLNLGILYDECMKRPQDALAEYRAYQQAAGQSSRLIVDVWIRELQARTPTATAMVSAEPQP